MVISKIIVNCSENVANIVQAQIHVVSARQTVMPGHISGRRTGKEGILEWQLCIVVRPDLECSGKGVKKE